MTITEHLEFSVLTAPVAAVDRRALSQAWYSALYAADKASAEPTPKSKRADSRTAAASVVHAAPTESAKRQPTAVNRAALSREAIAGAEFERRGARSPLARKIERAFLHPRKACGKAAFSIDGEHGRVQVLLQKRGAQLALIAVCPSKAKLQVAQALSQARYALALRGINLCTQVRENCA